MTIIPAALAVALEFHARPALALMIGLTIFMIVFSINSAAHSYLFLAYSEDDDEVATNVVDSPARPLVRTIATCAGASRSPGDQRRPLDLRLSDVPQMDR
ncbi:MAG TPA: hypothetical protein VMF50_08850 [Candidatus Binataceae bacterium]|nr:hypothetical protein [Candidatus Binataceae bacterium]